MLGEKFVWFKFVNRNLWCSGGCRRINLFILILYTCNSLVPNSYLIHKINCARLSLVSRLKSYLTRPILTNSLESNS